MRRKIRILHLEDLQSDAELINIQLNKANIRFESQVVDTKAEFVIALKQFKPDIILADHSLTSFNSMEALKIVKEGNMNIPFLLVTSTVSEKFINDIMNEGAKGYILKDNLDTLPGEIKTTLDKVFLEGKGYPEVEIILPEEKLYDLRILEDMADTNYLADVVSIFMEETPKELTKMRMAAIADKTNVVAANAHKLKSSAGLLQANKLSGILDIIEETAKSGNKSDELIRDIEIAFAEYKKIEKSLKNRLRTILH